MLSRIRSSSSQLATLDDAELMVRIQAGDTAAFSIFYDRHAAAVFGFAYRIVRTQAVAEDVTQEAFVNFWRDREGFSADHGAARNWLLGITRNRAVDATRRSSFRRDRPFTEDFDCEAPECTELEVLRRADVQAIQVALAVLPDDQREVVGLAYASGLTQTEIATRLGVPLGTVKGRMRLALKKLRTELVESAPPIRLV